jgi:hypothetical protein
LKKAKGLIKDICLKERKDPNKKLVFDPNLWFYDKFCNVLKLNKTILDIQSVISISYITQTRAVGLPPEPVEHKALEKFYKTIKDKPDKLTPERIFEISWGMDQVLRKIIIKKDFINYIDYALTQSKISISDSASFFHPRTVGGKLESARHILDLFRKKNIPIPIHDLYTGSVQYHIDADDESVSFGTKVFHISIMIAVNNFRKHLDHEPHIGDLRVSSVKEPGKVRVITVSRFEHSAILHPLAHVMAELLALLDSTRPGLKASNHMWEFFKGIKEEDIPLSGIFSEEYVDEFGTTRRIAGSSIFIGSEDWTAATDSLNPHAVKVVLERLHRLNFPTFYLDLCIKLLIMPRRVYERVPVSYQDEIKAIKTCGVLQGDPVCKIVLHLSHLVSRSVAQEKLRIIGRLSNTPPSIVKDGIQYNAVPGLHGKIVSNMTERQYVEEIKNYFRFHQVPLDSSGRPNIFIGGDTLSLIKNLQRGLVKTDRPAELNPQE